MFDWNIAHQYWLNEVFLKFLFYPLPYLLFFLFGLCLFIAVVKRLRGELEPHWPGLAKLSILTVFWCVIFPPEGWIYSQDVHYLLGRALLFGIACFIIRKILFLLGRDGLRLLDKQITDFFLRLEKLKEHLHKIHMREIASPVKALSLFAVAFAFSILTGRYCAANKVAAAASILFALYAFALFLAYARNSCRRLLVLLPGFCLLCGMPLSIYINSLAAFQAKGLTLFACFIVVFSVLWISAALLAEEAPVRLALTIINTFSTIAAVVVNLFLPLINAEVSSGQPETAKQLTELLGMDFGTLLGIFFNIYILPLVAAGYLALLAKDIQKYWLKRHSEKPGQ